MNPSTAPSAVENRPKLWRFYRDRNLTQQQVAEARGRSREWVRRICLPFDDAGRIVPDLADVEWFFEWSGHEITAADWYPARLSPANVNSQPEGLAS